MSIMRFYHTWRIFNGFVGFVLVLGWKINEKRLMQQEVRRPEIYLCGASLLASKLRVKQECIHFVNDEHLTISIRVVVGWNICILIYIFLCFWCVFMTLWWFLMYFEDFLWLLMHFDDFLMTFWCIVMTLSRLWRVLVILWWLLDAC